MVILCGTRRKRIRRSATLKTLEEGAMKIPEGEQIIEAAGVVVAGPDRLRTLVQNAALMPA